MCPASYNIASIGTTAGAMNTTYRSLGSYVADVCATGVRLYSTTGSHQLAAWEPLCDALFDIHSPPARHCVSACRHIGHTACCVNPLTLLTSSLLFPSFLSPPSRQQRGYRAPASGKRVTWQVELIQGRSSRTVERGRRVEK